MVIKNETSMLWLQKCIFKDNNNSPVLLAVILPICYNAEMKFVDVIVVVVHEINTRI